MRNGIGVILAFVNIILYLLIIALWIAIPNELTLNISTSIFNACLTAILLVVFRDRLKKYYLSTQFKSFTSALISTALIFSILGFINYLAFKNPLQWDVSYNKANSITDQSKKILKSINEKIEFTIFAKKSELPVVRALLELYRLEKAAVTIEEVDVELRPDLVSQYKILKTPSVVVKYQKKQSYVDKLSELDITNSLIKITRAQAPIIYYTTDHGEVDLNSSDNDGGYALNSLIKQSNYELRKIQLSSLQEIPSIVNTLIIWGPKTSFFKTELKVIEDYLEKGGRLLVALDPNFQEDALKSFRVFLNRWKVQIDNNLVIDRLKHVNGSSGSVPIAHNFHSGHPITKELKGPVFFPLTSSIRRLDASEKVKMLINTSPFPASWGDSTPAEMMSGAITYHADKDIRGPLSLVATFSDKDKGTKIVAFGNSKLVTNIYKKFGKNFNLFINSLAWLIEEERLISFNLPAISDEPVFISSPQLGVIFYISVIFFPIVLFVVAFFMFYRRRN